MAVLKSATDEEVREHARRLGCPDYLLGSAHSVMVDNETGRFEVSGPRYLPWSYGNWDNWRKAPSFKVPPYVALLRRWLRSVGVRWD